ncbi:zf-HC2 domain-containing protein [candidate division KSB1 bacterium]|nr:zf-HC2 domain-containing protein [candidate division KSB1 bacterium]
MDTCKRFKKLISDFIEGSLSKSDRFEFEKHLEHCEGCHSVLEREKRLIDGLHHLGHLNTSKDFDTVLRTRIRIESGIGRRRLNELVWTWPAKIPVYGMSLALLLIAFVMVFEQIKEQNKPVIPQPYVNTNWHGGNPDQNTFPKTYTETENVIYMIDPLDPQQLGDGSYNETEGTATFGIKSNFGDSLEDKRETSLQSIRQVVY